MRRVFVSAAVAAAILLGIAGCGDGGEETTTASLTKEEWVTQANQICADSNAELSQAAQEEFAGSQPTPKELQDFATGTLLPGVAEQAQAIDDLPVPEGEEEAVSEIVDAVNQGVEQAQADPAALTSGKADPFGEANKLASAYGLTDCAS